MTRRVAVLLSGGGSNMVALVHSMTGTHPARPVLVLSNDSDAGGLSKAAELGVPVATVDHRPYGADRTAFESRLIEKLDAAAPDIICLAGFMRILTPAFIARYRGRMLNIHPSLLPKFQGLHTHARALQAGDTDHGCTVHEVTADLDDGPILGQARLQVLDDDTEQTLAGRVLKLEHRLYPMALARFAAGDRSRKDLA